MGKCTLRDIAKKAGVSPATVSRAFNNPSSVHQDKREKIFSIASAAGYSFNTAKKRSTANRSNVVALFVGDIRNTFYSEITYHAQNALISLGYQPIVFSSKHYSDKAKSGEDFLDPLISLMPAGIFMMSITEPPDFIEQLVGAAFVV
jgi:LacI family transcriptional regulator